jgi:hypothetical protein
MIYIIDGADHTCARVTRDDGYMRMECNCGKRSRWSETSAPVRRAQDRHADEVAGSWYARSAKDYKFGYDSRYPL